MKRKILFFAVLTSLTLFAEAGIVINTTITLGRKSRNCAGFGICSITNTTAVMGAGIKGTLEVSAERGCFIIGISEQDILNSHPDLYSWFRSRGNFPIEEDFVLSDELRTVSGTSRSLVIRKGDYPLTLRNGMYYFEIPLGATTRE
jgi:hypothetical protein